MVHQTIVGAARRDPPAWSRGAAVTSCSTQTMSRWCGTLGRAKPRTTGQSRSARRHCESEDER